MLCQLFALAINNFKAKLRLYYNLKIVLLLMTIKTKSKHKINVDEFYEPLAWPNFIKSPLYLRYYVEVCN